MRVRNRPYVAPRQRFLRNLRRSPRVLREVPDNPGHFEMEWATSEYRAAFHRTVVDHLLSTAGATFGRIEGQSLQRQAEIVCKAIDAAVEAERDRSQDA